MSSRFFLLLATSTLLTTTLACGPDKPADAPPTASSAAATSSAETAATTAPTTAVDPQSKARIDAAKASPAATVMPAPKADDPLAHGLVDTAGWFAPGLAPEGTYQKATLAEKGHAHADVTLKGGKCYVFVGFAKLATIIDLDLNVLKPTGEIAFQDDDDDSTPTIGKPPICPTEDASYTVDIVADHGAGDAAFQVFSKAK